MKICPRCQNIYCPPYPMAGRCVECQWVLQPHNLVPYRVKPKKPKNPSLAEAMAILRE